MFIFEDKFLPSSNYRYRLNKFGEVIALDSGLISIETKNGRKVIYIDWYRGLDYYDLAALIAIVQFNIKIPIQYWDLIEPIFGDGDLNNTNLSNINYRFKEGPIEIPELPEFYYIPHYTSYGINKLGVVINLQTKNTLSWFQTKPVKNKNITGGYFVSRIKRDYGESTHTSRHRLLGLTFLKYEVDPLRLVINHKNGIPGKDFLKNLEWVTRRENIIHAYENNLHPNKVRPIIAKNWNTGEIHHFSRYTECARFLGIPDASVYSRLTKEKQTQHSDGWMFKDDDGSEWPILDGRIRTCGSAYSIIARNIFTGECIIFNSIEEAAQLMNLCEQSVRDNVREERIIPINGYNFRYLTNNINWPNHSEKHLRIYKLYPKRATDGVLVQDLDGNEIDFFESIEIAAKNYNVSILTISRYCRGLIATPGKYFSRYKLTENLGPSIQ